ncbi:HPr kinase/phosphorylase [Phenylobacterium deserti]|uniref:HPr kinase/phosphorylase n=1 Tax=Phenylobacterium deserti TaxID=1914756 RepID=A0A328AWN4_9CAUL|nr:HPr kinase/phosphorylase [Phenylobacterium deserti]RAK57268.1 HPr kinase/phosphorylase [Phenylobacterium deserti]
MILHAGLIAQRHAGAWRGVLIEGPSGAGKSDLALRALQAGFQLVADDRTLVWTSGGQLFGRAPDTLHGLLEVRGLDVVRAPALPLAPISLVVRAGAPERLPDPDHEEVRGLRVPLLLLDLKDASAPAKLSRALARL